MSGEITISPIYQPPISYVQSYDRRNKRTQRSRLVSEEAEIASNILVLEVLAVGVVGGALYKLAANSDDSRPGEEK